MNLAEQVRQVHELKKAYEIAHCKLKSQHGEYAGDDLESKLKYYVTNTKDTEIYFLDMNDDYDQDQFLDQIHWFSCSDTSHSDAEKVAKEHGFITEMVEFEPETKALKITWGE